MAIPKFLNLRLTSRTDLKDKGVTLVPVVSEDVQRERLDHTNPDYHRLGAVNFVSTWPACGSLGFVHPVYWPLGDAEYSEEEWIRFLYEQASYINGQYFVEGNGYRVTYFETIKKKTRMFGEVLDVSYETYRYTVPSSMFELGMREAGVDYSIRVKELPLKEIE